VTTPTGDEYSGLGFTGKVCGVSIMRAGEAMEKALRDCCRYFFFFNGVTSRLFLPGGGV